MKSSYVKDEKRGALPSPTNLPACPIRVDTKVPAPHHFDNWAAFEQEPKPQWAGMVDAPLNSASCGEWCLVVINYSYSVVLSRVSEGGFEVYMLGLGEPEGLCSGCTPGNYCRRDLVIEPRDGALLLALNSDRTEVTEDGLG